jgi:endonuclease V-like protein UPF0215 family
MKAQARVLGIDDSCFDKFKTRTVLIAGVVSRLDGYVEGILSTTVQVDGVDSTTKIAKMIKSSRFRTQLKAVMLHGFTLAGFNIVDIYALNKKIKIPVICVLRKQPNERKVLNALKKLKKNKEKKIRLFKKVGKLEKFHGIYFKAVGIDSQHAKKLIQKTTHRGNMPEPVRLAHLIASGTSRGESKGRA